MDRDLLPIDSVKKLGLFKINLLPKNTLNKEFLSNYGSLQPPLLKVDKTLDN
jgi:hypothetical protein